MGAGEAACDLLMTSRLRSAAVADVGALQRRTAAVQIHLAFLFTPKVIHSTIAAEDVHVGFVLQLQ